MKLSRQTKLDPRSLRFETETTNQTELQRLRLRHQTKLNHRGLNLELQTKLNLRGLKLRLQTKLKSRGAKCSQNKRYIENTAKVVVLVQNAAKGNDIGKIQPAIGE